MNVAVYIALCLIWSSTWLAIKYVIQDVSPLTGAAARFWIAVLIFLGVHLWRRISFPPDWRTRLGMVAWGFPQIGLGYALVYWAEQHISSGMTALLFAAFPFWVAAFSARLIKDETWSIGKFVGLVLGAIGVGVVCIDPECMASPSAPIAVAGILLATLTCGLGIVCIKRYYGKCDTAALTALQMLGGAVALTVAAFVVETPTDVSWTTQSIVATAYLAIFGSAVAFFGYFWLLKRVESTVVATITFVTPVIAIFWGWLLLDEPVSRWLIIGGVLVLVGVRTVVRSGPGSATHQSARPAEHETPKPSIPGPALVDASPSPEPCSATPPDAEP